MYVMFAGDTHGDFRHMQYLIQECLQAGIELIFVLGDFGYWEHFENGKYFLDVLNKALIEAGIVLYWLDGNHENHPLLWEKYKPRSDGFVEIRSNIIYSPRGHRWEWAGVKFMSMGGAYSIDKDFRETGTEWWPTEMITEADVLAAPGGKVDVLLSHDISTDVDIGLQFAIKGRSFFKADSNTIVNRHRLQQVVDKVNPDYIWHGHYHMKYTQYVHNCRIVGLNCNNTDRESFELVELKALV